MLKIVNYKKIINKIFGNYKLIIIFYNYIILLYYIYYYI